MREAVGVSPIRNRRALRSSIDRSVDLKLLFVAVVVHIERDLVEILFQVGNRPPHHSRRESVANNSGPENRGKSDTVIGAASAEGVGIEIG